MRIIFDIPFFYPKMLMKHGYKNLIEDLYRYEKRLREWNPDYIDLIKGIGDGASEELDKSRYPSGLSHYEKALFMQVYSHLSFCHPVESCDPSAREKYPIEIPQESAYWQNLDSPPCLDSKTIHQINELDGKYLEYLSSDCTSIAAMPEATANNMTMLAGHTQYGFGVGAYILAFAVKPPNGNSFWTSTIPGMFLNLKGVNDKGLALRVQFGGKADSAYGVLGMYIYSELLAHANKVEEAIEIITRGTPEYRQRTGRKSVVRAGGALITLADEREVAVVESTSHYYAVRHPGDFGEKNFVVCANHPLVNHSYDENNVKTDISMMERAGLHDDGKPGSSTRYWAAYWEGMKAHGRINVAWLQNEFLASHAWYNKEGERTDCAWSDKHKMHLPVKYINPNGASTICSHRGGYPESYMNEIPCPFVSVPAERAAYWIVYKPEFWIGPWEMLRFE